MCLCMEQDSIFLLIIFFINGRLKQGNGINKVCNDISMYINQRYYLHIEIVNSFEQS